LSDAADTAADVVALLAGLPLGETDARDLRIAERDLRHDPIVARPWSTQDVVRHDLAS
jgi:hypothetical protein